MSNNTFNQPDNLHLESQLQQWFGFSQFNLGQKQVIQHLLAGQSSLAIFPTGSGKSLCYQFSALCLPNVTLVVSPLLALMKDQLAFLATKGISAASIDSTLTFEQTKEVMQGVREGQIKILMVSVERFKNERFRRFLSSIAISMLVVDEAHCISEWGHNFRPDYLKLPQIRTEFNIAQVLLLTATAKRQVKLDMAAKFGINEQCIVQTGFERSNLHLQVIATPEHHKRQQLLASIGPHQQQGNAGIVYVTLQQSAEDLASFLTSNGIAAQAYHAGLDTSQREQIQDDFMSGAVNIIVATIAFGMGVDKSDIRFVIHYDLPKSIENYSQEIGRAGRDGNDSQCITLANKDGINTIENFVYGDTPQKDDISELIKIIHQNVDSGVWEMQESAISSQTNIRLLALKTLLVQLEIRGVLQASYAYFADFKYKFELSETEILAKFNAERQQFLKQIFEFTAFKKIWGQLDFNALQQTFGHERSRVVAALEYLSEKNMISLETKKITQVYKVNQQLLAENNLVDELTAYFADTEHKEIARIHALVAFFETDQCISYRLAQYFDDHNAATQCGRCSVCLGNAQVLPETQQSAVLNDQIIKGYIDEFCQLAQDKGFSAPDTYTKTKFLIGMAMPRYSRAKVRQLTGFATCQHIRFEHVLAQVKKLA
ncbi:RecQ family ATP-dependent DNA helicase [Shewanella sp. WXL01]|uniref:RecQ family ATP-dependent DNA helicase n=1 Tax=Shewanella sp. WXL01 TaxID=2709721 RepID=UPI0014384A13|nr:RecQ family ATP-dependent DNA helicase [Shewanella sp. WXL01]NKF50636.1 RecQ family ATP-dependent DNA helicase [Shewanella sp. WXL01]